MDKKEALSLLFRHKIVPVIRLSEEYNALKIIESLIAGGIKVIEISLLSHDAFNLVSYLRRQDLFVGVGTALDSLSVRKSIDAGACFIVSPHTDKHIITLAQKGCVLTIPGCLTPNEVMNAARFNVELTKIFPVASMGGPSYIKSLKDVFPNINFMPTGGIKLSNLREYLKAGAFALGVSSSLITQSILENKDYKLLAQNAREYVSNMNL